MVKMGFKEKMNYLDYLIRTRCLKLLLVFGIIMAAILTYCFNFNIALITTSTNLIVFIIVTLVYVTVFLLDGIIALFFRNAIVVDGTVFVKGYYDGGSESGTAKGIRVRSNDEKYLSKWHPYVKILMQYEEIPVKMIIRKDMYGNEKYYGYYIDDYSYMNDDNREQWF